MFLGMKVISYEENRMLLTCLLVMLFLFFGEKLLAQNFTEVEAPIGTTNTDLLQKFDFNGDKVPDRVTYNGISLIVSIKDGVTGAEIFRWERDDPAGESRFSSVDIVDIQKGFPSIIISGFRTVNGQGARGFDRQYIIFNNKGSLRTYMVTKPDGKNYATAGRSVQCTSYPQVLINKGYNPGALCFWAGYDGALGQGGSGTSTALVKIESVNGAPVFKDITPTSDLPWIMGMSGTPLNNFPTVHLCSGGGARYDGLHMMSGTFLDYDQNGLVDLVTVGQHASIRAHQMVLDTTRPEGIRFITKKITNPSQGMSEFLKVVALNKVETGYKSNCVYVSGEIGGCNSTYDHLRCFENGSWHLKKLPGSEFSSAHLGAYLSGNGGGKIYLQAREVAGTNVQNVYFEDTYRGPNKGWVNFKERSKDFMLTGYACQINTNRQMKIIVTSKKINDSSKRIYFSSKTNVKSTTNVLEKCMQQKIKTHNFNFKIEKSEIDRGSDQLFVYMKNESTGSLIHLKTIRLP